MPVLVFYIFYGFCGDSTSITGHHIEFFVCFEDFLIPVKSSTLGIDFGQQLPLSFFLSHPLFLYVCVNSLYADWIKTR